MQINYFSFRKMKIVGNRVEIEALYEFNEFSNLTKFVEKMEKEYDVHKKGFFKIIPPNNWDAVDSGLTDIKIKEIKNKVKRPYKQTYEEYLDGVFHCHYENLKKEYTIGEFFTLAEKGNLTNRFFT